MSELQLIARHTIAVGNEDEVLPLLPKLAAAALTEPGCLAFEVYRRLDDERSYRVTMALAAHRETEHFKDLVPGEIVPRLESRVLESFDVPDKP